MTQLQDRVALVTGGGQGIGRAIALELARRGAKILINDVREESAAQTVQMVKDLGSDAAFVLGDVSKSETAETLIAEAVKRWGRLDILVNNAGITRDGLIMRMKEEDWDLVMAVNLRSAFLMSKAATRPMMKSRWGRIINISSIVGVIGNAGQANYSASKAALIGLTKTLAKELASRNVLVNAIAPGFIRTPMTDALTEDQKKALSEQIPAGRLGEAEDVARAVAFLASEDSSYITGQVLHVTGGLGM